MKKQTSTEEELILAVATHPKLNDHCWKLFETIRQSSSSTGEALQRALYITFPDEVNACEKSAYRKGQSFWEVAFDFVNRDFFYKKNEPTTFLPKEPTSLPIQRSSSDAMKTIPLHPNLQNRWWNDETVFHAPPVDDYLLMSHTS